MDTCCGLKWALYHIFQPDHNKRRQHRFLESQSSHKVPSANFDGILGPKCQRSNLCERIEHFLQQVWDCVDRNHQNQAQPCHKLKIRNYLNGSGVRFDGSVALPTIQPLTVNLSNLVFAIIQCRFNDNPSAKTVPEHVNLIT